MIGQFLQKEKTFKVRFEIYAVKKTLSITIEI